MNCGSRLGRYKDSHNTQPSLRVPTKSGRSNLKLVSVAIFICIFFVQNIGLAELAYDRSYLKQTTKWCPDEIVKAQGGNPHECIEILLKMLEAQVEKTPDDKKAIFAALDEYVQKTDSFQGIRPAPAAPGEHVFVVTLSPEVGGYTFVVEYNPEFNFTTAVPVSVLSLADGRSSATLRTSTHSKGMHLRPLDAICETCTDIKAIFPDIVINLSFLPAAEEDAEPIDIIDIKSREDFELLLEATALDRRNIEITAEGPFDQYTLAHVALILKKVIANPGFEDGFEPDEKTPTKARFGEAVSRKVLLEEIKEDILALRRLALGETETHPSASPEISGAGERKTPQGSMTAALKDLGDRRRKKFREGTFTADEFHAMRGMSKTTAWYELDGLYRLGILEIVGSEGNAYVYQLTEGYRQAPDEFRDAVQERVLSKLQARPGDKELKSAKREVSKILEAGNARRTLTESVGIQNLGERLEACHTLKSLSDYEFPLEPARVEVDMHNHTYHSDGFQSPAAIVYEAYRRGLKTIAITDHNTLDGILEAIEVGRILGVEVIPGVEVMTSNYDEFGTELLVYWPDSGKFLEWYHSEASRDFKEEIGGIVARQRKRCLDVAKEIEKTYPELEITMDDLSRVSRGGSLVAGHLGLALWNKYGREELRRILRRRDISNSRDLYDKIILKYFKENRGLPTPRRVVDLARRGGGVSVLAHPRQYLRKSKGRRRQREGALREYVGRLHRLGLQGIQVDDWATDEQDREVFVALAEEFDLVQLSGSDSHGGFEGVAIGMGKVGKDSPRGNLDPELGKYSTLVALDPSRVQAERLTRKNRAFYAARLSEIDHTRGYEEEDGYWDESRFTEDRRASTDSLLKGKWKYSEMAMFGDQPVGYLIGIRPVKDFFEGFDHLPKKALHLLRIAIDPGCRGSGIDSRLVRNFAQKAKQEGVEDIYVDVLAYRKDTIRFYERCGFKFVREEKHKGHPSWKMVAKVDDLFANLTDAGPLVPVAVARGVKQAEAPGTSASATSELGQGPVKKQEKKVVATVDEQEDFSPDMQETIVGMLKIAGLDRLARELESGRVALKWGIPRIGKSEEEAKEVGGLNVPIGGGRYELTLNNLFRNKFAEHHGNAPALSRDYLLKLTRMVAHEIGETLVKEHLVATEGEQRPDDPRVEAMGVLCDILAYNGLKAALSPGGKEGPWLNFGVANRFNAAIGKSAMHLGRVRGIMTDSRIPDFIEAARTIAVDSPLGGDINKILEFAGQSLDPAQCDSVAGMVDVIIGPTEPTPDAAQIARLNAQADRLARTDQTKLPQTAGEMAETVVSAASATATSTPEIDKGKVGQIILDGGKIINVYVHPTGIGEYRISFYDEKQITMGYVIIDRAYLPDAVSIMNIVVGPGTRGEGFSYVMLDTLFAGLEQGRLIPGYKVGGEIVINTDVQHPFTAKVMEKYGFSKDYYYPEGSLDKKIIMKVVMGRRAPGKLTEVFVEPYHGEVDDKDMPVIEEVRRGVIQRLSASGNLALVQEPIEGEELEINIGYIRKGKLANMPRLSKCNIQLGPGASPGATLEIEGGLTAEFYNLQAGRLIAAGEYDGAFVCVREAIDMDPDNIPAQVLKAQALIGLERYREARDVCNVVLRRIPRSIPAHILKVQALLGLVGSKGHEKFYKEAVEICNYLIKAIPKDITPHLLKAQASAGLQRYKEAESCSRRVLESLPNNIPARLLTVHALINFTRYAEARKILGEILQEGDYAVARDLLTRLDWVEKRTGKREELPSDTGIMQDISRLMCPEVFQLSGLSGPHRPTKAKFRSKGKDSRSHPSATPEVDDRMRPVGHLTFNGRRINICIDHTGARLDIYFVTDEYFSTKALEHRAGVIILRLDDLPSNIHIESIHVGQEFEGQGFSYAMHDAMFEGFRQGTLIPGHTFEKGTVIGARFDNPFIVLTAEKYGFERKPKPDEFSKPVKVILGRRTSGQRTPVHVVDPESVDVFTFLIEEQYPSSRVSEEGLCGIFDLVPTAPEGGTELVVGTSYHLTLDNAWLTKIPYQSGCKPRYERTQSERVNELIRMADDWENYGANEDKIMALACNLLGISDISQFKTTRPVKPIILAAGRSTRWWKDLQELPQKQHAGMHEIRYLSEVAGKIPIIRILDVISLLRKVGVQVERPVIIVNPDSSTQLREVLQDRYDVEFVVQEESKGTGHAVLQAKETLADFRGDVMVMSDAAQTIRPETYLKCILLHQAVGESAMTIPTAIKRKQEGLYAPLMRDPVSGAVVESLQSHLESQPMPERGEDDLGMFLVRMEDLFPALELAHRLLLDKITGSYTSKGIYRPNFGDHYDAPGELGFPNEMIRTLAQRQDKIVLGLAMADPREASAVKRPQDVAFVTEIIRNLGIDEETSPPTTHPSATPETDGDASPSPVVQFSEADLSQFVNELNPHLQKAVEEGTMIDVEDLGTRRVERVSSTYPNSCEEAALVAQRLLASRYGDRVEVTTITGVHEKSEELHIPLHIALIIKNNTTGKRYYLSFFEGQFKTGYEGRHTRLVKLVGVDRFTNVARPDYLSLYRREDLEATPPLLFEIETDDDIRRIGKLVEIIESRRSKVSGETVARIVSHLPESFQPVSPDTGTHPSATLEWADEAEADEPDAFTKAVQDIFGKKGYTEISNVPIGGGVVGKVYSARDPDDRLVAIKITRPPNIDRPLRGYIEEMRKKVKFWRRSGFFKKKFPNVVQLYDAGFISGQEIQGYPGIPIEYGERDYNYQVMEFAEGETIWTYDFIGETDTSLWIDSCLGLISGINAMHEDGLVHDHLGRGDVIVTKSKELVACDFDDVNEIGKRQNAQRDDCVFLRNNVSIILTAVSSGRPEVERIRLFFEHWTQKKVTEDGLPAFARALKGLKGEISKTEPPTHPSASPEIRNRATAEAITFSKKGLHSRLCGALASTCSRMQRVLKDVNIEFSLQGVTLAKNPYIASSFRSLMFSKDKIGISIEGPYESRVLAAAVAILRKIVVERRFRDGLLPGVDPEDDTHRNEQRELVREIGEDFDQLQKLAVIRPDNIDPTTYPSASPEIADETTPDVAYLAKLEAAVERSRGLVYFKWGVMAACHDYAFDLRDELAERGIKSYVKAVYFIFPNGKGVCHYFVETENDWRIDPSPWLNPLAISGLVKTLQAQEPIMMSPDETEFGPYYSEGVVTDVNPRDIRILTKAVIQEQIDSMPHIEAGPFVEAIQSAQVTVKKPDLGPTHPSATSEIVDDDSPVKLTPEHAREIMLGVRQRCLALGDCKMHSEYLARRLIEEGFEVVIKTDDMHWWVEVLGPAFCIVDAIPEGLGDRINHVLEYLDNRTLMIEDPNIITMLQQNGVYQGIRVDEGLTRLAYSTANSEAFYAREVDRLSALSHHGVADGVMPADVRYNFIPGFVKELDRAKKKLTAIQLGKVQQPITTTHPSATPEWTEAGTPSPGEEPGESAGVSIKAVTEMVRGYFGKNGYTEIDLISHGGNSFVYAAKDSGGKAVALKVAKPNSKLGYAKRIGVVQSSWKKLEIGQFRALVDLYESGFIPISELRNHTSDPVIHEHFNRLEEAGIGLHYQVLELLNRKDISQLMKEEFFKGKDIPTLINALVAFMHGINDMHRAGIIQTQLYDFHLAITNDLSRIKTFDLDHVHKVTDTIDDIKENKRRLRRYVHDILLQAAQGPHIANISQFFETWNEKRIDQEGIGTFATALVALRDEISGTPDAGPTTHPSLVALRDKISGTPETAPTTHPSATPEWTEAGTPSPADTYRATLATAVEENLAAVNATFVPESPADEPVCFELCYPLKDLLWERHRIIASVKVAYFEINGRVEAHHWVETERGWKIDPYVKGHPLMDVEGALIMGPNDAERVYYPETVTTNVDIAAPGEVQQQDTITVQIPPQLQGLTDNKDEIKLASGHMGDVIDRLIARFPQLQDAIMREGQLADDCFIIDVDRITEQHSIDTTISARSELCIVPVIKSDLLVEVAQFAQGLRDLPQQARDIDNDLDELVVGIDTDIGNLEEYAKELCEELGGLGIGNLTVIANNGRELGMDLKSHLDRSKRGKPDKKVRVITLVKEKNKKKINLPDGIQVVLVDDSSRMDGDKLIHPIELTEFTEIIEKALADESFAEWPLPKAKVELGTEQMKQRYREAALYLKNA